MTSTTHRKRARWQPRTIVWMLVLIAGALTLTGCDLNNEIGGGGSLLARGTYLAAAAGGVELAVPDDRNGAWVAASQGREVTAGSRVRTTTDGRAKIAFADGSSVELEPNSELHITELDLRPEEDVRVVRLQQLAGRTRHVVVADAVTPVAYEVHTTEGAAVTHDGTFLVEGPAAGQTRLVVSDGVVQGASMDHVQQIAAGRATTLVAGAPPQPAWFVFQARGLLTELSAEAAIVAGRSLRLHPGTFIEPGLQIDQVVLVDGRIAEDGTLVADRIVAAADDVDDGEASIVTADQQAVALVPGRDCVMRSGVVVALDGEQLVLQDGTRLLLADLERIEGEVALYDTVAVITCRDGDQDSRTTVIVLDETDEALDGNGLVTVCHQPPGDPNNAETVTIADRDVAGHVAHGDYLGPCALEGTGVGAQGAGVTKVTICHRPPGNPDNAHTITIGEPAVAAHLAHGDTMGACPNGDGRSSSSARPNANKDNGRGKS